MCLLLSWKTYRVSSSFHFFFLTYLLGLCFNLVIYCSFDLIHALQRQSVRCLCFSLARLRLRWSCQLLGFSCTSHRCLCLFDLDERWEFGRVSSSGFGILAQHHKAGRAEQRLKRLIATDHSLHADSLWTFRYAILG